MKKDMKKDLAQLIKDNPGAIFTIDNDCWWMNAAPPKPRTEMSDQEYDKWSETILADSDNVFARGDGGYGTGSTYGGDILQALAEIVGVKLESV